MAEPEKYEATSTPTAPDSPEPDWTGRTVGDFRVLRRLGQGGMGEVYLAEQISLKRHVALKFLKPELAANKKSLERFKREAEAVARVTHANIVQIYAIGEHAGAYYMALEYVEGRNLREHLEKKGTPDVLLGLRIMLQVAAALQRANELGIVHRDIKPENILLTRKGEVKVADFGLSRCFTEDAEKANNLTGSRETMGTPLYMSPEQVEGKATLDHRSDIYSFGVTCYHMFAGHPPFQGTSPFEVAVQHVQKEPQPLAEIRPDLPADLCAIIHKMMAKKPEERYQTAREVQRDVGRLRDAVMVAGTSVVPAGRLVNSGEIGLATASSSSRVSLAGPPSRRRWLAILMIPAVLALGFALGYANHHVVRAPLAETDAAPTILADEPMLAKAQFSPAEQERLLLKNWHDSLHPTNATDIAAGLKHAIDLGLFYLREKRLDDAERFAKELEQMDKRLRPYQSFGVILKANVLAFRDQPAESNKIFLAMVERTGKGFDKLPATGPYWKTSLPLREMIAKSLQRNYVNAPDQFPPQLEPYRHPPRLGK
ncbi:MAG: serine/threonine protein kinase [Gemmataceae bacterium]|nr:serine/threonine protein kinase [Gemmataceae bacterium]